jgi:hypothetical protein
MLPPWFSNPLLTHQPVPGGIHARIVFAARENSEGSALGQLKPDYLPSICQPTSRILQSAPVDHREFNV